MSTVCVVSASAASAMRGKHSPRRSVVSGLLSSGALPPSPVELLLTLTPVKITFPESA